MILLVDRLIASEVSIRVLNPVREVKRGLTNEPDVKTVYCYLIIVNFIAIIAVFIVDRH